MKCYKCDKEATFFFTKHLSLNEDMLFYNYVQYWQYWQHLKDINPSEPSTKDFYFCCAFHTKIGISLGHLLGHKVTLMEILGSHDTYRESDKSFEEWINEY